jgi:pyruvate dehydrogenase E1 component beta subunit
VSPETTFLQAINRTLAEAMRADERVIVLGEDVAEGGPYLATKGLAEEFGEGRVRNTPISEGAVCGVAIGAAQAGLRPVVEIMFIDFITLALDQLVNQAAKAHSRSCSAPRAAPGNAQARSTRRASRPGSRTSPG